VAIVLANEPALLSRTDPPARLLTGRVVAILRAPTADAYRAVVEVLITAGITSVELTLTTPGTLAALPSLVSTWSADADIGVGTVVTAADAARAMDAGAAFVVTPTRQPEVVAAARRRSCPVYPGALTPTEVEAAWAAGACAVKLFPAATVGPAYLRALRGPFPEIRLVPSGGIAIDSAPNWLRAGALAVGLGSELLTDALHGGDLRALGRRAARCRALVDEQGHER